jgi:uncharacterized membrane protein YdbT with pleckstrin-like domain
VSYPQKLLTDQEEMRLDVHPHWSALVPAVWPPVLLLALNIALGVAGVLHHRVVPAAELTLWVMVLVYSAYRAANYYATDFVVTTNRIIFRHGIFSRNDQEIPLASVTNTNVTRSFIERFLGNGTLIVESAGRDSNERFDDIAHTETVLQLIHQLIENRAQPLSPERPASTFTRLPASSTDIASQLERLVALHDAQHLTDDEFAKAKATLLQGRS